MYPQQQQLPQFYPHSAPNPFLFSIPLASDSALLPPPTDPLPNSTPSCNWIVKHSDPIRYNHAVGPSLETSAASASFPSTWNGTWPHQFVTHDATVQVPNQNRVTKPLRCEVCKIDCNSQDVYQKHISGKKHQRNLQLLTNPSSALLAGPLHASVQSHANIGTGMELKSKDQKLLTGGASTTTDFTKFCTACNVVCTSQDVYDKHMAGKKHAAQVGLMSNNGIGPYIAAFKRQCIGPWKKAPKKIKADQSVWCDVCKIKCNSRDIYIGHLAGKKHLKNLEKLSKPKIDAGASTATENALQQGANPIIGPQEKPGTNQLKSLKASEMDIATKKQKVVEGGAAADAVRICTLCNVVCNSQTVFDTHIAGHKHNAMVKKHQSQ